MSFPSAVYQSSLDRVICFVTGADGQLYDKYWDGQQWVWEPQGSPGVKVVSPSAVYQSSLDRVICFVIGADGQLYDKYWDGQQWVWESQGNPGVGASWINVDSPSAVYQSSMDRVMCFVRGDSGDGQLYDKYWDGQQWVWESQGNPGANFVYSPQLSAVYQSSSLDRVICFVCGDDLQLYDIYWGGQQWAWENQGTPSAFDQLHSRYYSVRLQGPLSAVYQSSLDRLICFAVGVDFSLYTLYWRGQYWTWEIPQSDAGVRALAPSAVYQSSLDRVICFVTSAYHGELYDEYWDGHQWVWEPQGSPGVKVASPSAVYQSSMDRVICFVIGEDGQLYDKYWDGQQWVWESQGTPLNPGPIALQV